MYSLCRLATSFNRRSGTVTVVGGGGGENWYDLVKFQLLRYNRVT